MHLRLRHFVRNVLSTWLATAANMAVGFFLGPFIVHHLGDSAYGVWVLSISSVNYLALLDLGMRSSVLRFVSREKAVGAHDRASDALSAALWVRLQISALVLVLSAGLAWFFPQIFHVQPSLAGASRLAVMIIGFNLTMGMCTGVFGGVLSAVNRYDLQTAVTLLQMAVRVTGVVLVLRQGGGLVGIALSECAAAVVGNTVLVTLALKSYPEMRVRFVRPARAMLRELWSYSFYVFLQTVALQLIYQTDNMVVGHFVSDAAVTFYSIGSSLCRYTDQFVGSMSMTFVPAASTYDASGDRGKLRALYYGGTRAMLALSLPILTTLMLRGRTFIGLWMGPRYEQLSGTVLLILAGAMLFSLANNTAGAIAMGTDRHKFVARCVFVEGVANLTLSVILVHFLGTIGVAVGTLIPNLFIHLVVWPAYLQRMLNLSRWEIYGRVWGVMFLAAAPFAVATALVQHWVIPHSLLAFFLETIALLPVFYATAALLMREQVRTMVLPRLRERFAPGKVSVA